MRGTLEVPLHLLCDWLLSWDQTAQRQREGGQRSPNHCFQKQYWERQTCGMIG